MSWKKNAFSYLIWFVYTIATGGILMGAAGAFCTGVGTAAYWGILFAVAVFLGAGVIVLFLYRFRNKCCSFICRHRTGLHVLEAVLVMGFFAAGIVLRIQGIEEADQISVYYEAAKVASGQRIPQIVHGAVYLYVHVLHLGFALLGNHFAVGLWLQIIVQLGAFLILFFIIRRLYGSMAALTTLGLCTCGPYMTGSGFALSPEFLFFFLFIVSAAVVIRICGSKLIYPVLCLPAGILAAFCAYMDICGSFLLLLATAVIFCCRRPPVETGQKLRAAFFCVLGAAAGFFAAVCMDAFLSEKSVGGVLDAWIGLYHPGAFRLPVVNFADFWTEGFVLFILLTFGCISFWCDRWEERMTPWLTGAGIILAAQCYGIFTEEMPGYPYFYLLLAVTAGIGIGQCFQVSIPGGESSAQNQEMREMLQKSGEEADEAELEPVDLTRGSKNRDAEPEQADLTRHRKKKKGEAEPESVDLTQGTESKNKEAGLELVDLAESGGIRGMTEERSAEEEGRKTKKKSVKYIENPLPLPKKHQKRVFDYPVRPVQDGDDFDHPVAEDDDYDI